MLTIRSILIVFSAIFIHQSTRFLEFAVDEGIVFNKKPNDFIWEAEVENLQPGVYYLSVGRPRGRCIASVFINSKEYLVDSNKNYVSRLRKKLSLGGPFEVSSQGISRVTISCDEGKGSKVSLTHRPVVSFLTSGVVLQVYRILIDIILGPLFSLILLVIIFLSKIYEKINNTNLMGRSFHYYLLFAFSALLYSMSLSHIYRLFLTEDVATTIHIFLRNFYGLSGIVLITSFINKDKSYSNYSFLVKGVISIYLIYILSNILIYLFIPNWLIGIYIYQVKTYPIITAVTLFFFRRKFINSYKLSIIKDICLAWVFAQLFDVVSLQYNIVAFNAPALISLFSVMIVILIIRNGNDNLRVLRLSQQLLSLTEREAPVEEIGREIASTVHLESPFVRVSMYLDGHLSGVSQTRGKMFIRIYESGYVKDTEQDRELYIDSGRGLRILEAIEKGRVVKDSGPMGELFTLIPVGKIGCINLSNTKRSYGYQVHEDSNLFNSVLPELRKYGALVEQQEAKSRFSLHKVKRVFGNGEYDVDIGCIFLDISGYSSVSPSILDSYTRFIDETYLPELVKSVAHLGYVELFRGDEIYFVVLGEIISQEMGVGDAVLEALAILSKFRETTGLDLCTKNGFPEVGYSIGATIGKCSLVVSDNKVSTNGETVIQASRLQSIAEKNTILVNKNISRLAEESELFEISHGRNRLIKKNTVNSYILKVVK